MCVIHIGRANNLGAKDKAGNEIQVIVTSIDSNKTLISILVTSLNNSQILFYSGINSAVTSAVRAMNRNKT